MSVRYFRHYNPDGSSTFQVKCSLEFIDDVDETRHTNPVVLLDWSEEKQEYTVAATDAVVPGKDSEDTRGLARGEDDDDDDDFVVPDVSFGGLDPSGAPSAGSSANSNVNAAIVPLDDDNVNVTRVGDADDDFLIPDVPFGGLDPSSAPSTSIPDTNNAKINSTTETRSPLLARECWCARLFQPGGGFETATALYGELGMVVPDPNPPVWCPLSTNPSTPKIGTPGAVCSATAVVGIDGVVASRGYTAVCYSEDPLEEFAKSAWPLCCFWMAMLVYVGCITNYGKRCQSYLWRKLALAAAAAWKRRERRRSRAGTATNAAVVELPRDVEVEDGRSRAPAAGAVHGPANGESESGRTEDGGGRVVARVSISAGDNNENENDNPESEIESEIDSADAIRVEIEREFGSYENYELLDYDLRYLAQRTDNEYITWLWYSAVHREEVLVHRERNRIQRTRRRRRREQRRRQLRGNSTNTNNGDQEENSSDSDHDGGNGSPRRQLDPVYWWPPSGPEGTRWQHLITLNAEQGRRQQQQQRNSGVLCLRTKVFSARDRDARNRHGRSDPGGRAGEESVPITSLSTTTTTTTTTVADTVTVTVDGEELPTTTTTTRATTCATDPGGQSLVRIGDDDGDDTVGSGSPPAREHGNSCADTNHDDGNGNGKDKDCHRSSDYEQLGEDVVPESTVCSICLCEIEDGDIVGDIPCGHYFHKDCLKEWLVKNNLCPFCRRCDIAVHKPRTETEEV